MIRRLRSDDIETVIALGRAMHAESIYAGCDFDAAKLQALGEIITGNDQGLAQGVGPENIAAFVAESDHPDHDGELVGMFVATCNPMWFGRDRIAGDLAFYVTPPARGRITALLLLRQFEAWARGPAEAKWIAPGISTRIDHERVRDLYLKLGYRPFGERFLKEV
jgi:GNAT superfamily N-acetyltransferase